MYCLPVQKGIDPLWEDPANEPGGKWVLTVRDECLLDTVWEEMVQPSTIIIMYMYIRTFEFRCFALLCICMSDSSQPTELPW